MPDRDRRPVAVRAGPWRTCVTVACGGDGVRSTGPTLGLVAVSLSTPARGDAVRR